MRVGTRAVAFLESILWKLMCLFESSRHGTFSWKVEPTILHWRRLSWHEKWTTNSTKKGTKQFLRGVIKDTTASAPSPGMSQLPYSYAMVLINQCPSLIYSDYVACGCFNESKNKYAFIKWVLDLIYYRCSLFHLFQHIHPAPTSWAKIRKYQRVASNSIAELRIFTWHVDDSCP